MIEVFISSPVDSLKKERQAVKEAILELPGMNPVLSEDTMPAQSRPSKMKKPLLNMIFIFAYLVVTIVMSFLKIPFRTSLGSLKNA